MMYFLRYGNGDVVMSKREKAILVRVSDTERKELQRKAKLSGMSVSNYVRTLLVYSDDACVSVIDTTPLKNALYELSKQGVNLNQFMRFLNTYGVEVFDRSVAESTLEKERDAFSEIRASLASLQEEARNHNVSIVTDENEELEQ